MSNKQEVYSLGETIYFYDEVNTRTTNEAIVLINQLLEEGTKDITLKLKTPGGNAYEMLALIQTIRDNNIHVHAQGLVASAGFIMLCAAPRRSMDENAILMYHQLSAGVVGTLTHMDTELEHMKLLNKKVRENYIEQYIDSETLDKYDREKKDYYMDYEQAIEYGIIKSKKQEKLENLLIRAQKIEDEIHGDPDMEELLEKLMEDEENDINGNENDNPEPSTEEVSEPSECSDNNGSVNSETTEESNPNQVQENNNDNDNSGF